MLENYKDQMECCALCHDQCVSACPMFAVERKTTVYPSRKSQIARCIMIGDVDFDEESAELFYHCCGCRQCKENCVHSKDPKDPPAVFREVRRRAIEAGIKPGFVKDAEGMLEKYGNFYGDAGQRQKEAFPVPGSMEPEKTLYFVDAETLFLNPEAASAAFEIMKRRGVNVQASSVTESGYDMYSLGFEQKGKAAAAEAAAYIAVQNATRVVVSNPKEYYALTAWYSELGLDLNTEVVLETSFLYDILIVSPKEVSKRFAEVMHFLRMKETATYHDGSYMARYIGEFDKPRQILRPMFRRFVDMYPCRERAKPVAPADFPLGVSEKTLEGIAAWRIADLESAGVDLVVTSDPLSNAAFKKYWHADRVLSIPEALLKNYVEKIR